MYILINFRLCAAVKNIYCTKLATTGPRSCGVLDRRLDRVCEDSSDSWGKIIAVITISGIASIGVSKLLERKERVQLQNGRPKHPLMSKL
jgi:hypothetical protein